MEERMRLLSLIPRSCKILTILILLASSSFAVGVKAGTTILTTLEVRWLGGQMLVQSPPVSVAQEYGLDLSPGDEAGSVIAGYTYYFPHTITNVGNGSDLIHFELSGTTTNFASTLIKDENMDSVRQTEEVSAVLPDTPLAEDAGCYLFVVLASPTDAGVGAVGRTTFKANTSVADGGTYLGANGILYGGPDSVSATDELTVSALPDTTPPTISDFKISGRKRFPKDIISRSPKISAAILDDISNNVAKIEFWIDNDIRYSGSPEDWQGAYQPENGEFTYKVTPSLDEGTYTFKLKAWDKYENAAQEVLTPLYVKEKLGVIGPPVNHPNPFSPLKGEITHIAYTLTVDSTITIYLYDLRGRTIWKRTYMKGFEGGMAGYNEVPFNGFSDFGEILGNGMYFFQITHKNKVVGKGKLTVFDRR